MNITKFIKEFGNDNFARDVFFYFTFLKQHRYKKFTRQNLYKQTGIRPHRQIEIEKVLRAKGFLPNPGLGSCDTPLLPCPTQSFPSSRPSPGEVAIRKIDLPMATSNFIKPQVFQIKHATVNGGVYEEVFYANPPNITQNTHDKIVINNDFVIQKEAEDKYIAISKSYPDITVTLTSFQVEIALQNPLVLERTFQAKQINSQHDRVVMAAEPFKKYLDRIKDKIDTSEEELSSNNSKELVASNKPTMLLTGNQLKERKKESNKERKKEKVSLSVKESTYMYPSSNEQPSNVQDNSHAPTLPMVVQEYLVVKEEKERKKEINKERKKEKEESFSRIDLIDYVVREWNQLAEEVGLAKVCKINDRRRTAILRRMQEKEFDYPTILAKIRESDFLSGRTTEWRCDFDFVFLSAHNYIKILEGKYDNNTKRRAFVGRYKNFPDKIRETIDFAFKHFGKPTTQGQSSQSDNEQHG